MQTLVAYVENKPGVLNRVASLARRLAINIDSLTVGPTENEEIARMTIVAHTDEKGAHRLEASLEKLVDVLLAENISTRALLERDLALIKVSADQQNRPHLMELIKVRSRSSSAWVEMFSVRRIFTSFSRLVSR